LPLGDSLVFQLLPPPGEEPQTGVVTALILHHVAVEQVGHRALPSQGEAVFALELRLVVVLAGEILGGLLLLEDPGERTVPLAADEDAVALTAGGGCVRLDGSHG
jgi:hypothetical protein